MDRGSSDAIVLSRRNIYFSRVWTTFRLDAVAAVGHQRAGRQGRVDTVDRGFVSRFRRQHFTTSAACKRG